MLIHSLLSSKEVPESCHSLLQAALNVLWSLSYGLPSTGTSGQMQSRSLPVWHLAGVYTFNHICYKLICKKTGKSIDCRHEADVLLIKDGKVTCFFEFSGVHAADGSSQQPTQVAQLVSLLNMDA